MVIPPSSDSVSLREELVGKCPFFDGLTDMAVDAAIAHGMIRTHPTNQIILLENDWGSSIHFILEGWVKVRTHNLEGKEITLNVLSEGDLFGEMAALDATPRSTDVITLLPTRIASLPAQDFVALVQQEPMAAVRLSQILARRLRQVNRRLRLREADSVARVVDVLLFLAEAKGILTNPDYAKVNAASSASAGGRDDGAKGSSMSKGPIWEVPNLPHRELSSLSGLARETVTRVLSKLEKEGHIQRDRDVIRILDFDTLDKFVS